jgi:hypothetical protein
MYTSLFKLLLVAVILNVLMYLGGCKKLVEIPPPTTMTSSSDIYSNDATAASVLTGIYTSLSNQNGVNVSLGGLNFCPALSADELTLYDKNNTALIPYYRNSLTNSNSNIRGNDYWLTIYNTIYTANAVISGVSNNTALTPAVGKQLLGEAKFIRAFCYFYLVNFYGDVPMPLGTGFTINAQLARTPQDQVYQQIIADLKDAESLLSANYLDGTVLSTTDERVRPTTWASSAMLARTYLYIQKWDSAEAEVTKVINNNSLFSLDSLNEVFLANSSESIWQWQPTGTNLTTGEGGLFVLPAI